MQKKPGWQERKNYKWIYLFLLPTFIVFVMFYLVPVIQVFVTSFTSWYCFNSPKFNGLSNYVNLFKRGTFLISLKNLLAWSLIAMTLHVGFGTLVAFILFRQTVGMEIYKSGLYDTECHFCGCMGDDVPIYFQ